MPTPLPEDAIRHSPASRGQGVARPLFGAEKVAALLLSMDKLGVQRVPLHLALGGHRLAHEARRMDDLDGLLRGQAGRDEFAAAGKAEHDVLLDESEGDMQVGLDEAPIYIDRRAAPGVAQRLMLGERLGIVVHHAIARGDLGADDAAHLLDGGAAMQASGDEDGDALHGNARGVQAFQQRRQGDGVWRGPGDVAYGDGRGTLSGGESGQGRRTDWAIERGRDGSRGVGERTGGTALDHGVVAALGKGHR